MKKTFFLSAYLSILAIMTQFSIFGADALISALPIFIYSFGTFCIILSRYRWLNVISVIITHISFLTLLIYHHFFQNGLTLSVVCSQWYEGILALIKGRQNTPLALPEVGILLSMVVTVIFSIKYKLYAFSWKTKSEILAIFVLLCAFGRLHYNYEKFSQYEFDSEAKYFGYPVAWGYEIITRSGQQIIENKLEENIQYKPLKEFENIPSANHIYIIQFESFDYNAIDSGAMPFLSSILSQSAFYKIKPHFKKSSANADFQVLAMHPIYNESIGLLYKMIQEDYFVKHITLPRFLKEKGYLSYFYHGNSGSFFNRRPHIEKMGFDKIYFKEDMQSQYPVSEWGVDDQNVADFISKQPQKEKTLTFFITVSSHFDFSLGKTYTKFIQKPETLREMYLNTINYADGALRTIIEKAPQNSIFFIYSDHDSETSNDRTTAFIIYHKNSKISRTGTIEMQDIPTIIYQIIK